jgi:hypothetical protein
MKPRCFYFIFGALVLALLVSIQAQSYRQFGFKKRPPTQRAVTNELQGYLWLTIAGYPGQKGTNDGLDVNARFNLPNGIATDGYLACYVADGTNKTIRIVESTASNGFVSTILGKPKVAGTVDGTNRQTRFSWPGDIAADGRGIFYVTDTQSNIVRKFVRIGTNYVLTTIAGQPSDPSCEDGINSSARFFDPTGIAAIPDGKVFVSEPFNQTIRSVTLRDTNWVVRTLAGKAGTKGTNDGEADVARFNQPWGLAAEINGDLFIADAGNHTIRKLTKIGGKLFVTTIAGKPGKSGVADGANNSARFNFPRGIALDPATNLFVADTGSHTIRKIVPRGTNWIVTTIGGLATIRGYTDGIGDDARFHFPSAITTGAEGRVYVADTANHTIRVGFFVTESMVRTNWYYT